MINFFTPLKTICSSLLAPSLMGESFSSSFFINHHHHHHHHLYLYILIRVASLGLDSYSAEASDKSAKRHDTNTTESDNSLRGADQQETPKNHSE